MCIRDSVQTVNEGGGGTGSGNTNNSGSQVTTSQSSGLLQEFSLLVVACTVF